MRPGRYAELRAALRTQGVDAEPVHVGTAPLDGHEGGSECALGCLRLGFLGGPREVRELLLGRQRAPIEEAAKRWRRAGVPIVVLTSFGKRGEF